MRSEIPLSENTGKYALRFTRKTPQKNKTIPRTSRCGNYDRREPAATQNGGEAPIIDRLRDSAPDLEKYKGVQISR